MHFCVMHRVFFGNIGLHNYIERFGFNLHFFQNHNHINTGATGQCSKHQLFGAGPQVAPTRLFGCINGNFMSIHIAGKGNFVGPRHINNMLHFSCN